MKKKTPEKITFPTTSVSPTNNEGCEGVRWKLFGLLFQLLASGKCSTEDYCRTRSTGRRKHPRQHDPVIASVCVWRFVCCATIRFWLFRPRCISPRAPGHTWADGATHDGWRVIHELWEQLHRVEIWNVLDDISAWFTDDPQAQISNANADAATCVQYKAWCLKPWKAVRFNWRNHPRDPSNPNE